MDSVAAAFLAGFLAVTFLGALWEVSFWLKVPGNSKQSYQCRGVAEQKKYIDILTRQMRCVQQADTRDLKGCNSSQGSSIT